MNKLFALTICPSLMIIAAYFATASNNSLSNYLLYCAGSAWFVSYLSSFKMGIFVILPLGGFKDYLKDSKVVIPKELKKTFYTSANFLYSFLLVVIYSSAFVVAKLILIRNGVGTLADLKELLNLSVILILLFETSGFYSLLKDAIPFVFFLAVMIVMGILYKIHVTLTLSYLTAFLFFTIGYGLLYYYSKIAYSELQNTPPQKLL